jgi:hypothetical protein
VRKIRVTSSGAQTTTQTDRYQQYALPEFPDFVVIDTTYRCNVICGMCHLTSKTFHIPANPHISIELVKRAIDKFGSGREFASVPIAFDLSPAMHGAPPKLAKTG